ncbi:MAG: hypothetical protein TEF_04285 [Rhizobiales bacterium NRL2]|jgi:small-conductance mechanosensitive channel|nr:MAG: hypothetical protein TEF_04285 [Rhizobiales bacterium NRL2]
MEEIPLVQELGQWIGEVLPLIQDRAFWTERVLERWVLLQVALALGLLLASIWLQRRSGPMLLGLVGRMAGQRTLQRFVMLFVSRRQQILYMILLWLAVIVLANAPPARTELLGVLANLVTAWVVISIISRIIRNKPVARSVALVIWTVAALNILGILPATIDALDNIGLSIGDTRITALSVVNAIGLSVILIWLSVLASRLVESRLEASQDLRPATRVLLGKLFRIVVLSLAVLVALDLTGIDLTALAVFGGALGLGLGFGLQKVISNLVSGFILLMDKSIKPGDVIELDETFGWITKLQARYVSVITRDGREYLIPNEDLITNRVINWSYTDANVRLEIAFGVAYGSNPHQVRELAVEAARTADRVLKTPTPVCHFVEFGDSSLKFVLRFWIRDPADGVVNIKGKVMLALWDTFQEHGVTIPFPHREVYFRNPLEVVERGGDGAASRRPDEAVEPPKD